MTAVLSRYCGPSPLWRPCSDQAILVLAADGRLIEWSCGGEVGWLRAMSTQEKHAAEDRLLAAPVGLLLRTLEASRIWVAGQSPQGTPVGLVGGQTLLPSHPDYLASGWLAPDGLRFFPCSAWEHDDLAEALIDGGTLALEGACWLRIKDADWVGGARIEPTAAQESWLRHPRATVLG